MNIFRVIALMALGAVFGTMFAAGAQTGGAGKTPIPIARSTATPDGNGLFVEQESRPVVFLSFAFASIPTCNAAAKGEVIDIKDATVPAFGATVTSNGGNGTLARCDGTAWKAM